MINSQETKAYAVKVYFKKKKEERKGNIRKGILRGRILTCNDDEEIDISECGIKSHNIRYIFDEGNFVEWQYSVNPDKYKEGKIKEVLVDEIDGSPRCTYLVY